KKPEFASDNSGNVTPALSIKGNAIEREIDTLCAIGPVKPLQSLFTGEEDETIQSELKGVKLFIKRGSKEFTDGIYGHIKILAHTKHQTDRLLFRREPLGQVSANIKIRPAVHCAFDAEENILRVIHKELVEPENKGETQKEVIVIYALKPGRASKADFKTFSEDLLANAHLKAS
ncbi:hypothetical protein SERLA73DRAFT_185331, partial [Serpula lacrymans var. lacrymans S7.3]